MLKGGVARRPGSLWRCRNGTTAIEFAIVALPLIWIIGAILEVGALLLYQSALQAATEKASRLIWTNQMSPAWQASDFKAEVCRRLTIYNCVNAIKVDVRNAATFAALDTPSTWSVGPSAPNAGYAETFQPGKAGRAGSVIVTYDWKFIFFFLGDLGNTWLGHFKGRGFDNVPTRTDIHRIAGKSIFMNEM